MFDRKHRFNDRPLLFINWSPTIRTRTFYFSFVHFSRTPRLAIFLRYFEVKITRFGKKFCKEPKIKVIWTHNDGQSYPRTKFRTIRINWGVQGVFDFDF